MFLPIGIGGGAQTAVVRRDSKPRTASPRLPAPAESSAGSSRADFNKTCRSWEVPEVGETAVLERGRQDEPVNVSLAELTGKSINEAFSSSTNVMPLNTFSWKTVVK